MFVQSVLVSSSNKIYPKDVVSDYKKVKGHIETLVKNKNIIELSYILTNVNEYLVKQTGDEILEDKKIINNVSNFLLDLPLDLASSFLVHMAKLKEPDEKNFKRILKFHTLMVAENKKYCENYHRPLQQ